MPHNLIKKELINLIETNFHREGTLYLACDAKTAKRDDFDFDIVTFPFLDGDVPRSTSYGVCISQLIRLARVSSHVDDFNTRNKV